jgi:tetratricopeptide (TPR) repeat protein
VLLMRLNKILVVACLLFGSSTASLGKALDEDIFRAQPKTEVAGSFAKTVDSIEATNKAAKARRLIEVANSKISLEPNNDKYLAARAQCRADLRELDLALADINRALAINPSSQAYLELRGSIEGLQHDDVSALRDFDKAVLIGLPSAQLCSKRATVLLMLNRYAEARKEADRAIALDPSSPNSYATRGLARYNLHDYEGATADCTRAESLDKNAEGVFELHDFLSKHSR